MIGRLLDIVDGVIVRHHERRIRALGGRGLYTATAGHKLLVELYDGGFYTTLPEPEESLALADSPANRHAEAMQRAWYRRAYRIGARTEGFERLTRAMRRLWGIP